VAKKRKKKRNWLKKLLFVILTPLIIWFLAFVIWFYWNDMIGLFSRHEKIPTTKANKQLDGSTKPTDETSQERIREEDRRKLDEILKNKK
jgi:flagellar biosynthesis/type III secretory pathway M-ring protein FliF/YscJ